MAVEVRSLASGSSGNSILVRNGGSAVLIDAGIGIRKLIATLLGIGLNPSDLSATLITHEHSDHTAGAVRMAQRFRIPIVANAPTLQAVKGANHTLHKVLDVGEETAIGDFSIRSFPVSHDAVCPVGYTIASSNVTICSATDTGVLTSEIRDECAAADLLIIESNHDVEMLRSGPYPWHLKQRIMSNRGHLSNETTSQLLLDLAASGRGMSVWLAHLSKTNNTPRAALATARRFLAEHIGSTIRLEVAQRDVPSVCWRQGATSFQMSLFSGAGGR